MKPIIHRIVVRLGAGLKLTKGVMAVGALFILLPNAKAQFTWPVYEPFGEYTDGEQLGTNDSLPYWNVGNAGTNGVSSYIISSMAAMSFPALTNGDTYPVPLGVMSQYQPNSSADRGFMFTTNTLSTGAIYASCLLNYIDNGSASAFPYDRTLLNLATGATDETNGSFGAVYSSVWLTADYRLKINKNWQQGGVFSSTGPVIATNVPHVIVVRYKVVAGGNDEMDLWIDPFPFGNNAAIPPPTVSTTNGPNIANFNALVLNSRKTSPPTAPFIPTAHAFYVDEIRLGDTWSSVTPLATPPPGPIFKVTGGGTTCPNTTLDVGLSGSVSTNVYLLYTNNVFSGISLTGTGSLLDFGQQSVPGVYSVLASNAASANIGWMSNSVTVAFIPPPTIVTEPIPVVTATNNRAEFTVGVSGVGFKFQWYQDGTPVSNATNITGATTNDLVIWPAATTNIGNYYCVISNTCNESSTTTTNSLTLDAPSNLVYYGNNFAPAPVAWPWDIGISFSWNTGGAVFNEGDNVTFDDSYTITWGTIIPLTGTLTPSSITYGTSYGLTWAGAGSLAGSGSLLVDGSGVLSLSNNSPNFVNSYSGGTVISNGTVNMHNSNIGLGTGPITLAGGTLETFQKGSGTGFTSSSGLTNNLYVTASSTWQVDRTGNQCAGLVGTLIGSPGTTLTIYNSATNNNSANEIRFGGVFTNNSAIVTSVNPLAINSPMQIGSFNSTGAEVYNGSISGPTAAFFVSGAGAVYLNGANTYTNVTTVSAGFLAGSGSIAGPLTVASGGTLGGGSASAIGTFTVNGNVTNSGKIFIRVDKSLAQSNDMISATGVITNSGTGTVTVTNIGAAPIMAGDTFQIFSQAVSNGAAMLVTGGGVAWTNNLAVNGSILAVNVLASYPTNISSSVNGHTLAINWPATHQGWILQNQTNKLSAGLGTNWIDIPNTQSGTGASVPLSPTNGTVFYRLRHP